MGAVIDKLWKAWLEHRDAEFFDYDGMRWQLTWRPNECSSVWHVVKILLPKERTLEQYDHPIPYYENNLTFRSLL